MTRFLFVYLLVWNGLDLSEISIALIHLQPLEAIAGHLSVEASVVMSTDRINLSTLSSDGSNSDATIRRHAIWQSASHLVEGAIVKSIKTY